MLVHLIIINKTYLSRYLSYCMHLCKVYRPACFILHRWWMLIVVSICKYPEKEHRFVKSQIIGG